MNPRDLPPLSRSALALVAVKLVAHLATNLWTPYEFHRDAFLYTAMGTHLRFLHMDFPPFMAVLAQGVRGVLGSSVFAMRLVPALAGTAVLLVAVLIARELGGRGRAQVLAALVVLVNPLFLRSATLFQPIVFDQLWWLLGVYALLRIANGADARWWLVLGAAGGLGLFTKFSIVFFGTGVIVALLLTPMRRAFLGPWPWIALGLVLVLGFPSIIGQVNLGFPVLEQMDVLRERQLARVALGEFVLDQVLMQPAGFVLALGGMGALLLHPSLAPFRVAGWIALSTCAILVVLKGKSYYYGPMHPLLFAAGAVAIEQIRRPRLKAITWLGAATAIGAWGILAIPFGLPIVPPEPMARFSRAIGITTAVRTNWGEYLPLPQDYADMLGWREKAEAVARFHESLPPDDQAEAVVFGANYGQAGALDFYGRELGLPPVISLAGSFYLFGPGERPGRIIIFVGVELSDVRELGCRSLVEVDRVENPWGVPEERDVPIVVCRDPTMSVQELWRRVESPRWG